MFNTNVTLNQLVAPSYTLGFAAQWLHQKRVNYWSVYHDGHQTMVEKAWHLLDEADVVVGYNSKRYDLPILCKDLISTIPEWGPPLLAASYGVVHPIDHSTRAESIRPPRNSRDRGWLLDTAAWPLSRSTR
jgi:hypothetical protein